MMASSLCSGKPSATNLLNLDRNQTYSVMVGSKRACSELFPLTSSKLPKLNNRKVKFADPIVHLYHNQAGDRCSLWYQHREYQRIKNENRKTILEVQRVTIDLGELNSKEFCTRGLESVIGAMLLHIPANRQKKVVNAVLCMQKLMRQTRKLDCQEPLRAASTTISRHDMAKALKRASVDAMHRNSIGSTPIGLILPG